MYFAVCGNAGPWDEYNPLKVVYEDHPHVALKFFQLLGQGTIGEKSIRKSLDISTALLEKVVTDFKKCGLIKEKVKASQKIYMPTFAIMTVEIWEIFDDVIDKIAVEISCELEQLVLPFFENAFQKTSLLKGIKDSVCLIVIGAFGLDAGCLNTLEK